MCGIAGAVWNDPRHALSHETLERMTRCLVHRGPDDEGFFERPLADDPVYGRTPGVALGFRRLSIIDLAHGHQPFQSEGDQIVVVFNGEIYNYKSIRRRLEGSGHAFTTDSDTESVVRLLLDEGTSAFPSMNGMFAIGAWDARRRRLILARDRMGKKPLYYYCDSERLYFASELKALAQAPDVPLEVDERAVDEYLTYQYVPYPNTIFRDVKKLPPGTLAVYENGRLSIERFWSPDWNEERPIGEAEAIERVRELFRSSVELRMQSDVPLGAFLSGGIDSSLTVAMMQQLSSRPTQTFSIRFPIAAYDESDQAERTAAFLKTEHRTFDVTPEELEILPELVSHYDEPFADSSAIPTWHLCKRTREEVTVALTGDGGDELFAGYRRYRALQLSRRLDRLGPLKDFAAAPFWQKIPSTSYRRDLVRKFKRFSAALGRTPARRYFDWVSIFQESQRAELYTDAFVEKLGDSDPYGFLQRAWNRTSKRDPVTSATLTDLMTYLPCDLMTKVDIASMAHSLECRQPFLDYRLIEFAIGLPLSLKMKGKRQKRLLYLAFRDLVPEEIWHRPKMGFGVPIGPWFRNEMRGLAESRFLNSRAVARGWFEERTVKRLWEEHVSGRVDHDYRLWALLVLELWLEKWGL